MKVETTEIAKGDKLYEIHIGTDENGVEKTPNMKLCTAIIVTLNGISIDKELFEPVLTKEQKEEAIKNKTKWVEQHFQKTSNF